MSYRYGHLVAQAIESVLYQGFDVIRLFDDGVHDCKHIQKLYPEVEYIERQRNWGIVKNFNDALERTETDRVLFLGADNWLEPETLDTLRGYEEDIVSYDARFVGQETGIWHLPNQPHGSALYDVKKAKEVGGYEHSGRENSEEDSMLFNKMIKAGATFAHSDKVLLNYRRHRMNYNEH